MNLTVRKDDEIIFTSDKSWLHPLFELMDFLEPGTITVKNLYVLDKLIGRGAAVLLAKMGITQCHGKIISKRALPVLEEYGIIYSYDTLVDQLECKTEIVLTDDMSLQDAFLELSRRAGR
jgi:Domain of unknown function (DUF1893)